MFEVNWFCVDVNRRYKLRGPKHGQTSQEIIMSGSFSSVIHTLIDDKLSDNMSAHHCGKFFFSKIDHKANRS